MESRLVASVTAFVPIGDNCEINKLTLKNNGKTAKEFSVFSHIEFCLWNAVDDSTNFQRNLNTGEVELEPSVIYHKTEYRERRNHYAVYGVNVPIAGFDTDRDSFLGAYRSPSNPEVVDPCIPDTIKDMTIKRTFRGAEYIIKVENPDGNQKGIKKMIVDGKEIEGNLIPIEDGKKHTILQQLCNIPLDIFNNAYINPYKC